MNRILIVNADDLGYTRGVNRAIARCSALGIVRSATLMANGRAFEDAVETVKRNGRPGVGVHLALTELEPVSRPDDVPDLVDGQEQMVSGPGALTRLLFRGKISRSSMLKELSAQVQKVLDCGLTPTHLDSHKHVHILPQVLDVVVEIALKHSIRWIRNPFDLTSGWRLAPWVERYKRGAFSTQHLKARLSGVYRPTFERLVRRSGLRMADHFCGVSLTGIWNEALVARLLERLPQGINEWMIHPGDCDEELLGRQTRLLQQRERERDLFSSPMLLELSAKYGITLSGYGEINA